MAVAGTHPDTNAPYTWQGGRSPVNTPRALVPLVKDYEVQEILARCVQRLRDELGWTEQLAEVVSLVPQDSDTLPPSLEERLAATEYKGQHGLNDAILAMTADRISSGMPVADVVEECMQFVRGVWDKIPDEHPDKAGWNWNQQRDQITDACYGFIKKECGNQSRIIETLQDWMLKKWRDIEARGGAPFLRKRKHWGVEDKGPADPIPDMEAPLSAASEEASEKQKRRRPANVLVPFKAFDVASPCRACVDFLIGHYMRRMSPQSTAGMEAVAVNRLIALVEAVVLMQAEPLLREPPSERCRVWDHCGDDNMEELSTVASRLSCQRIQFRHGRTGGLALFDDPTRVRITRGGGLHGREDR